jgi:hypothetical protein
VNYLEMVARMATAGKPGSPERAAGQRAAALAVGVLMLMGGAGGLPFADDLGDLIDAILQRLGYSSNVKNARHKFFQDILGDAGGDFVEKGISGVAGFPMDLSGRMGMGNLIPGTGLLTQKKDHTRDVAELFGPAGDFATRAFQGAGNLVDGKLMDAGFSMAPKAVANLRQGLDMWTTGAYRDQNKNKVIDTTAAEALTKAIGFQPQTVARMQQAAGNVANALDQTRLMAEKINQQWALGMAQHDPDMIREAQAAMKDWNEKNPESRIKPNLAAIQKKAHAMMEDKAQRLEKAAPRSMKAEVRAELAAAR